MRLYATVTSDRASKGQGGNREIVIDLTIDSKERRTVGRVVLRHGEKGEGEHEGYTIFYYPVGGSGRVLLFQEKGEKQKGEQVKVKTERTHTRGDDWHN